MFSEKHPANRCEAGFWSDFRSAFPTTRFAVRIFLKSGRYNNNQTMATIALHRNQPATSSYKYWPLIEEQVADFLRAWPEQLKESEDVIEAWLRGPLLQIAVTPESINQDRQLRNICAEIYGRHPDFFLAAVFRLRQLDSEKFGLASQVQRWLLLNSTVTIMKQEFPIHRIDKGTLARLFQRDTGLEVEPDTLHNLVERLLKPAA